MYTPPARQSIRNPFQLDDADPRPIATPSAEQPTLLQPSRKLKEFTSHLLNKASKPWATLSILGDAEHSKAAPAFVEGSPVTGEVRLDIEAGDAIHSVVVSVRGTSFRKNQAANGSSDNRSGHHWGHAERDGHLHPLVRHSLVAS